MNSNTQNNQYMIMINVNEREFNWLINGIYANMDYAYGPGEIAFAEELINELKEQYREQVGKFYDHWFK